ncbi:MAG: hypothetical protein WA667_28565 [Candidatus Nitrosopolaris sp.]
MMWQIMRYAGQNYRRHDVRLTRNNTMKVKLQKRFNRRVGDKQYYKWIVVLPDSEVTRLGWKEGIELEANSSRNGTLELKSSMVRMKIKG